MGDLLLLENCFSGCMDVNLLGNIFLIVLYLLH